MNIQQLNIITPFYKINKTAETHSTPMLNTLKNDTVSFTGSKPYDYKTTFAYMASEVLREKQKNNINTQPKDIASAVENIVGQNGAPNEDYYQYSHATKENNKFPACYDESLKDNIIESINYTRDNVFKQWENVLIGNDFAATKHPVSKKLEDPITRFVIWEGINFGITDSDRHLPPPLDLDVLDKTIDYFQNKIEPKERGLKASSPKFFSKIYNSMIIDNLLNQIITDPIYFNYKLYDSEAEEIDKSEIKSAEDLDNVWVKIPPLKRSKADENTAIKTVEVLSHENWCTRSRENKAKAALESGNFYIYLQKEPFGADYQIKTPAIAMTSSHGKIERIQGQLNNGQIPEKHYDTILKFLTKHNYLQIEDDGSFKNITMEANSNDEGPQAYWQLLIAKGKQDIEPILKSNNAERTFRSLFGDKIIDENENGFILKSYNSKYHVSKDVAVPVSMSGFDEDMLLAMVQEVTGVLDLTNAGIEEFPKNLKTVGKKIICTKDQYELFKDDIIKATTGELPPSVIEKKDTVYIYRNKR